jgi:poly(ADP-ribose) glycohydrolase
MSGADEWNDDHVRLPCSPQNVYKVYEEEAETQVKEEVDVKDGDDVKEKETVDSNENENDDDDTSKKRRRSARNRKFVWRQKWTLIESVLCSLDVREYENLVDIYGRLHPAHIQKWQFSTLAKFALRSAVLDERVRLFNETLPAIVQLALTLPVQVRRAIPLLRADDDVCLVLSQRQIASLLGAAFFALFPRRNSTRRYGRLPTINFAPDLFGRALCADAKYRCLFNYFNRWAKRLALASSPSASSSSSSPSSFRDSIAGGHGKVAFHRRVLAKAPRWHESKAALCEVTLCDGVIEDAGVGTLQVDFANKYVGGGIFGRGSAQEEIRFMICPELIAARLFTEALGDNECVVMSGAERYSSYAGYASTFRFDGDFCDETPTGDGGRLRTVIVAIDALKFEPSTAPRQFRRRCVDRELNKAYCAFSVAHPDDTFETRAPVCTGHWGCGAFHGDRHLKAIVQWLACSQARRPMHFYPFDDVDNFRALFAQLSDAAQRYRLSVSTLYDALADYYAVYQVATESGKSVSLFAYLLDRFA